MALTTSTAGHFRKKQYQPSITTYLNRDHPYSSSQPQPPISPLSPPLPLETQASLLSVGMRIRKSVPEGYKTHKAIPTQPLLFSSTAPARSITPSQSQRFVPATRELTPFCGLHKTGGWAAQDVPASSAPAVMITGEDEDALPGLTMSQNTITSSQNSCAGTWRGEVVESRKRGYEEDIEDELDGFFADEVFEDATVRVERPLASMKKSLRRGGDVERVKVFGVDDFGEAEFLVAMDSMEVDAT